MLPSKISMATNTSLSLIHVTQKKTVCSVHFNEQDVSFCSTKDFDTHKQKHFSAYLLGYIYPYKALYCPARERLALIIEQNRDKRKRSNRFHHHVISLEQVRDPQSSFYNKNVISSLIF